MEDKLYDWIIEKRSTDTIISGNSIRKQAILLYYEIKKIEPNKISFIASNGWMSNFLIRKNLVLRRITSTGRDLPTNVV